MSRRSDQASLVVLRQRSLSAVVIVAAAVIPAVLGHPVLTAALMILVAASLYELCHALSTSRVHIDWIAPTAVGVLIVALVGFGANNLVLSAAITFGALGLLAINLLRADVHGATSSWASSVAAVLYVAVPVAHLPAIREIQSDPPADWVGRVNDLALTNVPASGLAWLVLIVAVTWLTDVAAYLGGRALGRRKLAPTLSPGKTVEGALIGTLVGTLSGWAAVVILGLPLPFYAGLTIGGILSVFGQIGDLAESMIKRDLGIKDMGHLIPGHGGMLDRIDALLFTLPVGFYIVTVALEVGL